MEHPDGHHQSQMLSSSQRDGQLLHQSPPAKRVKHEHGLSEQPLPPLLLEMVSAQQQQPQQSQQHQRQQHHQQQPQQRQHHPESPRSIASLGVAAAGMASSFEGRMAPAYGYGYPSDQTFVNANDPNAPALDPNAMQFQFGAGTSTSTAATAVSGNPYGALQASSKSRKDIKRRTKTGCLTCRKRRIKCDETLPTCNNCRKSRRECAGYDPTFKSQHSADSSVQSPTVSAIKGLGGQSHQQASAANEDGTAYPVAPAGYVAAQTSATTPDGTGAYSTTSQSGTLAYDFSAAIDPALQSISVGQPTASGAAMYSQPGGDFNVEGEPAPSSFAPPLDHDHHHLHQDQQQDQQQQQQQQQQPQQQSPMSSSEHYPYPRSSLLRFRSAQEEDYSPFGPLVPHPQGLPFGVEMRGPAVLAAAAAAAAAAADNVSAPPSLPVPPCECHNLPAGADELQSCMRHSYNVREEGLVIPEYTYRKFCRINFGLDILTGFVYEDSYAELDQDAELPIESPYSGEREQHARAMTYLLPTVMFDEEEKRLLWEWYNGSSRAMYRIAFHHGFYHPLDPRRSLFKATSWPVDGRADFYHAYLDDRVSLTLCPVHQASVEELLQVSSLRYPAERPSMPPDEGAMQTIHDLFNYYSTGLAKFLETQWLPLQGWNYLAKDMALLEKYALLLSRMEFTAEKNPHENLVNLTVETHIIWDSLALVKNASDEVKATEAQDSLVLDPSLEADTFAATDDASGGNAGSASGAANGASKDQKKSSQIKPPPPPSNVDSTIYIDIHETALRFEVVKALITNARVDTSLVTALSHFDNVAPAHFTTFDKQILSRERSFWRNTARFLTLDTFSPNPSDPAVVDEALLGMRGLLESKENRDIIYSVAVMRVWPRRLMERELALKEQGIDNPQLDKDDLQKVDVAKNFLVQQAAGRGTTVASQRICGMILRAWSGASLG